MATIASAPPPALTFPRPIFAAVSPHPFLQAHLAAPNASNTPLRANGRAAHEFRTPGIHTGSLTHSTGSAVVRLGNTSVVCGVRAEILREEDTPGEAAPPSDNESDDSREIERLRLVVPNVELSTGSTPAYMPGNAPSGFAQSLVTRIRALLLSTRLLRADDLRILYTPSAGVQEPDAPPEAQVQVKGYWVLYVDVFFISIDGNAFDAAWMGILAALRDVRLPRAYYDEEFERILCSDEPAHATRLRLRGLPVASSFAVFEGHAEDGADKQAAHVLSDPDAFEEGVCSEKVCVVVDAQEGADGAVLRRLEKNGGGVVDRDMVRDLVDRAVDRWAVVQRVLSGKV